MHMGMEIEAPRMRVQHRDRARAALQLLVVLAEREQGLPGAVQPLDPLGLLTANVKAVRKLQATAAGDFFRHCCARLTGSKNRFWAIFWSIGLQPNQDLRKKLLNV